MARMPAQCEHGYWMMTGAIECPQRCTPLPRVSEPRPLPLVVVEHPEGVKLACTNCGKGWHASTNHMLAGDTLMQAVAHAQRC